MSDRDCELRELITHPSHSQNGSFEPEMSLLGAVIANNEQSLRTALSQATGEEFIKKLTHPTNRELSNRNILTLACVDTNVSEDIFQVLFDYAMTHFSHLDFREEAWYYSEAIHFAAFHSNVAKLRIIVDVLREKNKLNKLNVLSILSENALHVLLEYSNRDESFNVQLSDGRESRICAVIAEEKGEIMDCAELLIHAGININQSNIWNETPLIIAIRYRLLKVIELLLNRRDVDLDTCKDSFTGKSARDLLKQNEISMHLITPNSRVSVPPAKILFNFLKSKEEEMFLRYNSGYLKQYVNQMDGDDENNTTGTMLQLCLIKGYIEYVKENIVKQEPWEADILKTPMLKFFCRNGFGRSIEHLLNNGADITRKTGMFGNRDVLQMAVKLGYYPFLTILLEHKFSQITYEHIMNVLSNTKNSIFISQNCNARLVLFLLISKLQMFDLNIHNYDKIKCLNKILDLYLIYNGSGDKYRNNICQVLKLGASLAGKLNHETAKESTDRLKQITYDTLRCHLDECITSDNDVCYDTLIRDETDHYSETEALACLSDDPKKCDLLNHPALLYLVHIQWLKNSKFFYLNMVLYIPFLAMLFWYMILLQTDAFSLPVFVVFLVLLAIIMLQELVQCILYFRTYFLDFSNYLKVSVIIYCWINVFSKHEVAMIIAILLSTLIFVFMLGQLPKFSKFMFVYNSTWYYLQYASFYSVHFFSFALCFLILLQSDNNTETGHFGHIAIRLFDTLMFFIGQYDEPVTNPTKFPIFGRFLVALFVFCMTIILNNLMMGLIVTDMNNNQKISKRQRQQKKIRHIIRRDTFIKKMEAILRSQSLRHLFGSSTNVFMKGTHKTNKNIIQTSDVFDEDDKDYLTKLHENRKHHTNVLSGLYEYILSEIYSDQRNVRDSANILFKLSEFEK